MRRIKSIIYIWLLSSLTSYGNIYLAKSRVIINEKDNEATVGVKNVEQAPVLLQLWIDKGVSELDVSKISVPFVIAKPIIKLEYSIQII